MSDFSFRLSFSDPMLAGCERVRIVVVALTSLVGMASLLCRSQTAGGGSNLCWSMSKTRVVRTVPQS